VPGRCGPVPAKNKTGWFHPVQVQRGVVGDLKLNSIDLCTSECHLCQYWTIPKHLSNAA